MPLHHSTQLSLFGARSLIDDRILKRFFDDASRLPVPGAEAAERFLGIFSREAGKRDAKETSLEQSFGPAIFKDYLGYAFYPADGPECTAWPKPSTRRTKLAGEPDLLLGHVSSSEFRPVAVVEFKKPGVSLDGPQASYGFKSPVEQAFEYARGLSDCRWIIVSDMRFLRIYEINDPKAYEEFDLWTNPDDIRNIHRLISRTNLLPKDPNDSTLARLLERYPS